MKNQSNEPSDSANADKSKAKAPAQNAERQSGTKPADNRPMAREGDAQRKEQGARHEPTNQPGKTMPRVDDRPEQPRKDDRGDSKTPGAVLPNRGTPNYGDAEPNDPRKLDVDAGTGGRTGSADRSNRS